MGNPERSFQTTQHQIRISSAASSKFIENSPLFLFFSVFGFLTIAFSDKELKNRAKHAVRKYFKRKGMIESSNEKVEKVERERKV
jgi:hypothetical protein